MANRARIFAALPFLLAVEAVPVTAQVSTERDCTYDSCALSLEDGKLRRGAAGDEVGTLGWLGGGTGVLLAGPDSAAHYARQLTRANRQSWLVGIPAIVVLGALQLAPWSDASDGVLWAGAAATPLGFYALDAASKRERVADRSARRAIWWYNRQFTGSDGASPSVPMPSLWPTRDVTGPLILGGGSLGIAVGYAADGGPDGAMIGSVIGSGVGALVGVLLREW